MPDRISRWRRHGPESDQVRSARETDKRLRQRPQNPLTPDDERFARGIHDVRQLMNGEWTWDVLIALHDGPLHYTSLLNVIREQDNDTGWPGRQHRRLQDSPLNRTLRRLEQGELVMHNREPDFPYHATYELAPAAKELLTVAAPLAMWAETHTDLLERARQRRAEESSNR
ncbi:winged helix-turn-helix transcriptional regulator [Streptomyces xiangluensis]|uniref:Winged helix-turn-helix transcriptional regulator n=1 Tax=Streptomyces xiangluensis TaxID=2665720 RepID=A0ABV8YGV6_9ACTN